MKEKLEYKHLMKINTEIVIILYLQVWFFQITKNQKAI